jgi:hypothetical protein
LTLKSQVARKLLEKKLCLVLFFNFSKLLGKENKLSKEVKIEGQENLSNLRSETSKHVAL